MTEPSARRSIHKFPVPEAVTRCDVRQGARVLCVQTQDNVPCIWFEVDPDAPDERRDFIAVNTGGEVEPGALYVGTAHGIGGWMVFHIYERGAQSTAGELRSPSTGSGDGQ